MSKAPQVAHKFEVEQMNSLADQKHPAHSQFDMTKLFAKQKPKKAENARSFSPFSGKYKKKSTRKSSAANQEQLIVFE
jgi:hypothetical protein